MKYLAGKGSRMRVIWGSTDEKGLSDNIFKG